MPENAARPIGVFDSGLGGLTVLSAIHKRLPGENLVYFGDTARVPYGNKSAETIVRYSLEILDFLLSNNVKAVVVACNTASSFALEALRKKSSVPVMGVIEPGVTALVRHYPDIREAAVIATRSTTSSKSYSVALEKINPQVSLFSQACPLLVPLVEEGYADSEAAEIILRDYLSEIISRGIHHVILGCTHYPFLKRTIQKLYPDIKLIDSSAETATALEELLKAEKLHSTATTGNVNLFVSDITESMLEMKDKFFPGQSELQKISLSD